MMEMTDRAISAIHRFINSSEKPVQGLRVRIQSGGCAGFSYALKLDSQVSASDTVLSFGDIRVLVDAESSPLLNGVTLDFVEGVDGTGFSFTNPNAA